MAKLILTVDDSRTMRDMISFALSEAGFEVIEAEDGREGLLMLAQHKPDVIISDLNMPNMDGFEFIRELRKLEAFRFTPVLVLTTEGDTNKKEQGKAAGATGWLVKPFNPEKLLQVVNKVCQ